MRVWEPKKGSPRCQKGKKHTPEQIDLILCRIDGGEPVQTVCREVNISEATLYRWKQQYGAMEIDELKELRAPRNMNARLKRIVADQVLNIQVLKEVNSKNGKLVAEALHRPKRGCGGPLFPATGVPISWAGALKLGLPAVAADGAGSPTARWRDGIGLAPSAIWLPPNARPAALSGPALFTANRPTAPPRAGPGERRPGSSWQNGINESFNGRVGDE